MLDWLYDFFMVPRQAAPEPAPEPKPEPEPVETVRATAAAKRHYDSGNLASARLIDATTSFDEIVEITLGDLPPFRLKNLEFAVLLNVLCSLSEHSATIAPYGRLGRRDG